MELNSKQLLAIAAIGAALWYFTRQNGEAAPNKPAAATSGTTGATTSGGDFWADFGLGADVYAGIGQQPTTAAAVGAPAPAPAPAPAAAPAALNPWEMTAVRAQPEWNGSGWVQASGAPVSAGYAFGHLTPEQRAGRTDAEMIKGLI